MPNDFNVIVQKFGGTSVADAKKQKAVAQFISKRLQHDQRICVVVSAMGHTTNELIALAHEVSIDPPKRELDMLISCGERASMALLAMALNEVGIKAISLTGSQSGIITNDHHNGAEIVAIKPNRVIEAFQQYQVVIIAGFQGVSDKKEITTLKRGGSDTTAIAMACALNAQMCEIYTDVCGVMDGDPHIIAAAKNLPELTFDQMESMALYGAKVLAHDAVRLAKKFGISVKIASMNDACGTTIHTDVSQVIDTHVLAVTHLRAIIGFETPIDEVDACINDADYFLCGYVRSQKFIGYISNDISQEFCKKSQQNICQGLALLTIHLSKNQYAAHVVAKINNALLKERIALHDLIVGNKEIFAVIADEHVTHVLLVLHKVLLGDVGVACDHTK